MNFQPLPGRNVLYLPHRLFIGGQGALTPMDGPGWNQNNPLLPQFPFHPPAHLFLPDNAPLTTHVLPQAQHTTSEYSVTVPSTQTRELLNTNESLNFVFASRTFWNNLVHYAGRPQHLNDWTTWTIPETVIPNANQQIQAIRGLSAWYLFHMNRMFNIPAMNSEPSVQEETVLQILEPTNALLKTRYIPIDDSPHARMYPRWGRGIDAHHRTPGAVGNSGYPDFLLHRFGTQEEANNGAIGEAKTWWSYATPRITSVFQDGTVSNIGRFFYASRTPMAKLLLQIWGELVHFSCYLGFCTNGEIIIFLAKSGENTLIISKPRAWNDPAVHAAFAGLSFAAYDILTVGQAVIIDQILCPNNIGDRLTRW